jgi:2'-5' RNA ligase
MKIRSFLAFDLTDEVREELSQIIALLSPKAKEIRWVKPELMHCTMKFFGDVEEELLTGDLSRVIEETVKYQSPIHLKGVGIGVFPNWRYPRVIWAGLTGEVEAAISLHERLETVFEPYGLTKDERAFRLHLTLGRAKSPLKNCAALVTLVEKLVDKEFGEFDIDHLTLYKSVLTREGPVYTVLREFKLGGKQ